MRKLLQRLSRGVVLRRRLPKRFGGAPLFVSPDASLRYWKPTLETIDPTLYNAVSELVHPGDTVWDVGANVGLFAFAAAFAAGPHGRVLAFEPDPFLCGLLRRSAKSLPAAAYAPVEIMPVAVANWVGEANLRIAAGGRASNTLGEGKSQIGGVRQTQPTQAVTLDSLIAQHPPPNVLKIDVEDLELAVLQGATKLLANARPRLHIEMSSDRTFDLLREQNYTCYDADQPPANRQPLDHHAFNAICLPR